MRQRLFGHFDNMIYNTEGVLFMMFCPHFQEMGDWFMMF